jgi:hypothetical protein
VIALADENTVGPEARAREARVLDQNSVQPYDFIEGQLVLAGLQNGPAPSLKTVARRLLALDLEAGATVREQKETRRARDNVRAGAPNDVVRLRRERAHAEIGERFRFADEGAKVTFAEQIVAHLVAARGHRRPGEIKAAVQQVGETDPGGVLDIERAAGHEFIEEPSAPVRGPCRGAAHEGGDGVLGNSVEYPFQ